MWITIELATKSRLGEVDPLKLRVTRRKQNDVRYLRGTVGPARDIEWYRPSIRSLWQVPILSRLTL